MRTGSPAVQEDLDPPPSSCRTPKLGMQRMLGEEGEQDIAPRGGQQGRAGKPPPLSGHLIPPQPQHSVGSWDTHSKQPATALKALAGGRLTRAP